MSEKTIFKPRPGGRSQPAPAVPNSGANGNAVPKPGIAVAEENTLFVQPQN